jgi:hypothetical protein
MNVQSNKNCRCPDIQATAIFYPNNLSGNPSQKKFPALLCRVAFTVVLRLVGSIFQLFAAGLDILADALHRIACSQ